MGSGDWFKTIISKKKSKRAKSKHAKVHSILLPFFASLEKGKKIAFLNKKNSLSKPFSKPLLSWMSCTPACLACLPSNLKSDAIHSIPSLGMTRTSGHTII
jgi:hypothetical protein